MRTLLIVLGAFLLGGCAGGINARQKTLYRTPKDLGADALVHVQISLGKDYIAQHAATDAVALTAAWVLTVPTLGIVWVTPAARRKVAVTIDDTPDDESVVVNVPLAWGPGDKKGNHFWFKAKPGTTYTLTVYCSGLIKGQWDVGTFTVSDAKHRDLIVDLKDQQAVVTLK
jgi:hypothetical protein